MGVQGLWSFIKRKGYEPELCHQLSLTTQDPTRKAVCRIDVLGTFFTTIRNAYTHHPLDTAHRIVEKEISKIGHKAQLVLVLDGAQAKEKRATHEVREKARVEAKTRAQTLLHDLKDRISKGQRVRKWRFLEIDKNITKSFYWTPEARTAFTDYMKQNGWHVMIAETEADLSIACNSRPEDLVVSRDSDMIIYDNIRTICRPISRGRFLVYDVQEVAAALCISRIQLTVLGVVSRNDYSKNIHSLGCASNYAIIKELKGS
ncbi:hypothetical protein BGZ65_001386, partial [Modicella reniformis]